MTDEHTESGARRIPPAKRLFWPLVATGLALGAGSCSGFRGQPTRTPADAQVEASHALLEARRRFAPDSHLAIFLVGLQPRGTDLALTGEVDRAEAKLEALRVVARAGVRAADEIRVLPAESLGEQLWGIGSLSVASAREQPAHAAEMGTQILMGDVVRLWKRSAATNGGQAWFLAQSADGYLAWLEQGTFVRCAEAQAKEWDGGPLVIVTALEDQVLEKPDPQAQPVSDVVIGNRLRRMAQTGEWFEVALPDGRTGFLPQRAAEDYPAWKSRRHATPENIENTARRFLGRPYLWGANSPKGLDCSGFTKLVFFLNGIALPRNASQQAKEGAEVPLDADLGHLRPGDLLFFGAPARGDRPERIVHVGIYLGDKLFIHALGRVHLSSLDPRSLLADAYRIRTLRHARRLIPETR